MVVLARELDGDRYSIRPLPNALARVREVERMFERLRRQYGVHAVVEGHIELAPKGPRFPFGAIQG